MIENRKSWIVLFANTLAFTVCFACWMCYSILLAYLSNLGEFNWSAGQIGSLMAVPILTGSLVRLPLGVLTDRYGGRIVFTALMVISAVPMYLVSQAHTYGQFWWAGLGFGLTGGSFAVGIAYSSLWFTKARQGTALGIFGAGNAGAAITTMFAPVLLKGLQDWRTLPKIYAASLLVMAVLFYAFTSPRKVAAADRKSLAQLLAPLKIVRVWRFGLYYFLVFGGFVVLTNWLPIYFVNVYELSLVQVGFLTSFFVLPSGLIRAVGGYLSDRWGARTVMYGVLSVCVLGCLFLLLPKSSVLTAGPGLRSPLGAKDNKAIVTNVSPESITLQFRKKDGSVVTPSLPVQVKTDGASRWQETRVKTGDEVVKGELLARGVTHFSVEVGPYLFTFVVFVIGLAMGIGKAAVYKHIPDYFPNEVGVVGGMVGVLGGLGGYFSAKIFGSILQWSGIWTSCWAFLALLSTICLVWMHVVIRRMMVSRTPELASALEESSRPRPVLAVR